MWRNGAELKKTSRGGAEVDAFVLDVVRAIAE
jgi:hypothetical protein